MYVEPHRDYNYHRTPEIMVSRTVRVWIKTMKFKVIVSEGEDGWYVVECPALPGCVSQGKTIEDALENIKDAIQGCLEVLNQRARAFSVHDKVVEVVV